MEKDYSLLRPFDLEAVKRGEKVTQYSKGICNATNSGKLIAGPNKLEELVFEFDDCGFVLYKKDEHSLTFVKMAPLCWVEGKPVYKGDVLWHTTAVKVTAAHERKDNVEGFVCADGDYVSANNLSWTKPKVKREAWVNVYAHGSPCWRYQTKEEADNSAKLGSGLIDPDRVACIRIEWEE